MRVETDKSSMRSSLAVVTICFLFSSPLLANATNSCNELPSSNETLSPLANAIGTRTLSASRSEIAARNAYAARYNAKSSKQAGINCFGTTLSQLGAGTHPRLASEAEVEGFLRRNCFVLPSTTKPSPNDVGIIYDPSSSSLVHSFTVLPGNRAFYKDGVEASGGFTTKTNLAMQNDFFVGASAARCDQLMSNSEGESQMICPTRVRYHRCQNDRTPHSAMLAALEARIYSHAMTGAGPTDQQITEIISEIQAYRDYVQNQKDLDAEVQTALRERVQSLENYFGFYAMENASWKTRRREAMFSLQTIRTLLSPSRDQ